MTLGDREGTLPSLGGPPTLSIDARGITDVGQRRDHNEDAFLVDEALGLFVVADGMGGHAGGGTAPASPSRPSRASSRHARDREPERVRRAGGAEDSPRPRPAPRRRSRRPAPSSTGRRRASPSSPGWARPSRRCSWTARTAFVAHVGDSRCYLLREGRIYQVSEDHSLVNEQLKAGAISADEAKHSRFKNIITRSVGFEQQVAGRPHGRSSSSPGTRSSSAATASRTWWTTRRSSASSRRARIDVAPGRLVALANDRGGDDNITVIVIRAATPERAPAHRRTASRCVGTALER